MLGDKGLGERSGEIYLPYVGHIADQVVLLQDGSVMAMGHVSGMSFEMEEPDMRNARLRNLNTLFRNIADDNCGYQHAPDPPSRCAGAAGDAVPLRVRAKPGSHLSRPHFEWPSVPQ